MKYPNGQEVKLGDVVSLGKDQQGVVVGSIDSGEYNEAYPRAEWDYLKSGVLIEFPSHGLIHYKEPEPDLRLVARSSGRGAPIRLSMTGLRVPGMRQYKEIDDIEEIDQLRIKLISKLKYFFPHLDLRRINRESKPNPAYFRHQSGEKVLWWSSRPWIKKTGRPGYNNLFGYGRRGAIDPLKSEVEFNVPLPEPDYKPRRDLGGVFARDLKTNTVVLAHRGILTYGRRLQIDRFLDALSEINAPLIRAYGNARPFALIGSIDSLQLADEIEAFIKNFSEAKEACG